MGHTPPLGPRRGIGTLIGNDWLRENPDNLVPSEWRRIKGKSAMRKCQIFPAVGRALPEGALLPPPPPRAPVDITPSRRNPRNDVRMLPAYQAPPATRPARHLTPRSGSSIARELETRSWWDHPLALGALLLFAPPAGLAALWSSHYYSRDARWALTIMTGLSLCLFASVAIVALLAR